MILNSQEAKMQTAKDYDLIIQLFDKYLANKKTKTLTKVGFRKYLLADQAFPAWLVKNLMKQITNDPNLSFHVDTYLEHYIVEGMLLGLVKETAAKIILKNGYGYEENPSHLVDDKAKGVRQISLRPATLADKPKVNDEPAA